MDEQFENQIKELKKELFQQKETISSLQGLVKTELHRNFTLNLWELSDRELDGEMGDRLAFLNEDIDPKPDKASITSHRRLSGKPIILIKRILMRIARPYTNLLLEKQRRFNEQAVAFHLASFIRARKNDERVKNLENKIKVIQEDQELLKDRIAELNREVRNDR